MAHLNHEYKHFGESSKIKCKFIILTLGKYNKFTFNFTEWHTLLKDPLNTNKHVSSII